MPKIISQESMKKLTTSKSNLFSAFFLLVLVFFKLYDENLFPFSIFIPVDLAEKGRLATITFFRIEPTQFTHETYYPRLFLTPFFILYRLFDLKVGLIQFMMFFALIASLPVSAYILSEKLNGHSLGLILITYLIVNGNFANVIGILFLLVLIEKPTMIRTLILGFGYFPLLIYVIPYLFIKKKGLAYLAGIILTIHLLLIKPNKNFGVFWTGFNSYINGFNPYLFIIIELIFLSLFIWFILKNPIDISSSKLILPLTIVLIVILLIICRINFYWIVKSLILFPIFVTMLPWKNT